ncbi:MAG: ATP-binding protein [Flavobacterium sp.]|uniref:ATP-binding protein n=1 Tax=Flavobacterium sp. TaxID=239 RepID=UPI002616DE59|nr:ATP-binding protein [Flavobacterium sp.]MDD5149812.1 ATP-binding protein [Flavobacterium sp.]
MRKEQVKIPSTYFSQNIKRQYSSPRLALFREFLQNSVDAGSKNIRFELNVDNMVCEDDGCGMDTDRLIQAMLTLSGSVKGENATGGFGEAKNLLLFAHDKYFIHTRTNKVEGSCLSYELNTNAQYREGTRIQIFFHESFSYNMNEYIKTGKDFIARCNLPGINIYINNNLLDNIEEYLELVYQAEWCNIYTKSAYDMYYAAVRKNGIEMFEVYLNESSNKKFIIELTLNSIDCLSSNRDSMQYKYREELQKITNNIQMNKNMFGRLYNQTIVYKGQQNFSFIKAIKKFIKETQISFSVKNKIEELVIALQDSNTREEMNQIFDEMVRVEPEISYIKQHLNLESNFVVDIQKKGIDKLPTKLDPATMQKKYETLALLWKACVIKVIQTMDYDISFNIGWVISDTALAQFKQIDGGYVFQVNPEKHWSTNKKEMIMSLLTAACHEYTHINYPDHTESFTSMNFEVVKNVFSNLSSWNEITKISENITL